MGSYTDQFKKDFLTAVKERTSQSVHTISADFGIPQSTGAGWARKADLMKDRPCFRYGGLGKPAKDQTRAEEYLERRRKSFNPGRELGPLLKKWRYWTHEERRRHTKGGRSKAMLHCES